MNQKVVLPRFDLPRDSTRVAMRALWVTGGMVVLATLILGVAMWHRRSAEIATVEQAVAKAAAARRAALAPTPAPPIVQAAKAAQPGPAAGTGQTTLAATLPAAVDPPEHRASPRAHRGGKSAGKSRHMSAADQKLLGHRPSPAGAAKKPKSNDDVIDRLLNQYK
jgi:hypothetical protein